MDTHVRQDHEALLEELEEEYGAEETLTPEAEQLLQDLHPNNVPAVRQRAVERLGRLGASHPRAVRALITFREFDESLHIRTLAAEALDAPVHQAFLRAHPDLEERIIAGLAPEPAIADQPAPEEAPQPPEALRSQPAESLTWIKVWVRALTRPSVATFESLLRDPKASLRRAYTWIAATGLIAYIPALLAAVLFLTVIFAALGGGLTTEDLGELAPYAAGGAVAAPILSVLAFTIGAGLAHLVATALGGTGTYTRLAYAFATYMPPLIVVSVLSMAICGAFLALYAIVLSVLAVRAAHQLDLGKAIACVTPVVLLAIAVAFLPRILW